MALWYYGLYFLPHRTPNNPPSSSSLSLSHTHLWINRSCSGEGRTVINGRLHFLKSLSLCVSVLLLSLGVDILVKSSNLHTPQSHTSKIDDDSILCLGRGYCLVAVVGRHYHILHYFIEIWLVLSLHVDQSVCLFISLSVCLSVYLFLVCLFNSLLKIETIARPSSLSIGFSCNRSKLAFVC